MSAQMEPVYLHPSPGLVVRLEPTPERPGVVVADDRDTSPVQERREPDRCSLCWLNAVHSERIHERRMGR